MQWTKGEKKAFSSTCVPMATNTTSKVRMALLLVSLLAAYGNEVKKEGAEKRAQLFIVFGTQRSGTTYLSRLASNIDGILLYHEIFLKKKKQPHHIPSELWSKRMHDPSAFLDGIVDIATRDGLHAVGTVVQNWQLNKTALKQHIFTRKDIKYAITIRNNAFDIFMSSEKARIAHEYEDMHSTNFLDAYKEIKSKPMKLSADRFLRAVANWRVWYHYVITELMKRQIHPLIIPYETLNLGKDMEMLYGYLLHNHLGLKNNFRFVGEKGTVKRESGCPGKTITNMEKFASEVSRSSKEVDLNPIPYCLA